MFGWLKRRTQLAIIKGAEEDIDRFLKGLMGADDEGVALMVAFATHWRNAFAADGVNLLDPAGAEAKDHFIAIKINRAIAQVQKTNPAFASGLMVWLHTVRSTSIPEIRIKGRAMWAELERGFNGVHAAEALAMEVAGLRLLLDDPAQIPVGLEPAHR